MGGDSDQEGTGRTAASAWRQWRSVQPVRQGLQCKWKTRSRKGRVAADRTVPRRARRPPRHLRRVHTSNAGALQRAAIIPADNALCQASGQRARPANKAHPDRRQAMHHDRDRTLRRDPVAGQAGPSFMPDGGGVRAGPRTTGAAPSGAGPKGPAGQCASTAPLRLPVRCGVSPLEGVAGDGHLAPAQGKAFAGQYLVCRPVIPCHGSARFRARTGGLEGRSRECNGLTGWHSYSLANEPV